MKKRMRIKYCMGTTKQCFFVILRLCMVIVNIAVFMCYCNLKIHKLYRMLI